MTQKPLTNSPDLWRNALPTIRPDGHKYDRGHAVILAAPKLTGATRMASEACLRIGAGLVTVVARKRGDIYRTILLPDIMVTKKPLDQSSYIRVVLAGPGGVSKSDAAYMLANPYNCVRVFDAGAIPANFNGLDDHCIFTPHAGEFAKAFPEIDLHEGRSQAAAHAAAISGGIIVFKGAETVIAHPDGRVVINTHASPHLAKAGAGDILAGMITGLTAQLMSPFEACCAAVWMHGDIGRHLSLGLIASDMPREIAGVYKRVYGS